MEVLDWRIIKDMDMRDTDATKDADTTVGRKQAKLFWGIVIFGAVVLIATLIFIGAFTSEGSDPAGQAVAPVSANTSLA